MNEQQLQLLVRLAETGQADKLLQLLGSNVGQHQKQLTSSLLYGGGGLFTICASDQLVNASLNDVGLAGYLPWLPTTYEVRRQAAVTAIGDLAGSEQPDDQCADPPGTSWKGCEIEWCLGRIRHRSPEYDRLDQGERWCEKMPRFRLFGNVSVGGAVIAPQGSQIDNDAEWGAVQAAVGIRQTLGRWLYTGNRATSNNMFNGLQVLVNTGYVDVKSRIACPALDADVKDFEGDCITDSTITKNIYRYLDAVVGRIQQRAVGAGLDMPGADDLRIVARSEVVNALYEYWACSTSQCTVAQGLTIAADWSRQTADDLRNKNRLRVRGMDIPVISDDYQPFAVSTGGTGWMSDIYVLTMQVGGLPIVFGEYRDFNALSSSASIETSTLASETR